MSSISSLAEAKTQDRAWRAVNAKKSGGCGSEGVRDESSRRAGVECTHARDVKFLLRHRVTSSICACIQSVNGQASTRKDFKLTTTLIVLLPPDDIPSLCSHSQSTNSTRPNPPPRLHSPCRPRVPSPPAASAKHKWRSALHHYRRGLPGTRALAIGG